MILSFTPPSFNLIRSWAPMSKLAGEPEIVLKVISSESPAFDICTISALVSAAPGAIPRSADASEAGRESAIEPDSSSRVSPLVYAVVSVQHPAFGRTAVQLRESMCRAPDRLAVIDPWLDGCSAVAPLITFPALTVPAGFTLEDLPVGIEFLSRQFSEGTLFRLGYAFEQATHHRRPPATTPPLRGEP
jgi:hypothetical protein